jgi:hypothetical protein
VTPRRATRRRSPPRRARPKRAAPTRTAPKPAGLDERALLVESTWVHVFEEDESGVEVYRPESDAIPRSRRTRERLCFFANGTARILRAAPDDRHEQAAAYWKEEHGRITVTTDSAAAGVEILHARFEGKTRLLVRW